MVMESAFVRAQPDERRIHPGINGPTALTTASPSGPSPVLTMIMVKIR
jgi:hypothetical protein